MAVIVNPPPQLRIPEKFFNDPVSRAFFEQMRTILFQLWQRTGGSFDAVSGKQIVIVTSTDIVLDTFGALIVVDASDAPVKVTLPAITAATEGEIVDVAIIDATYDTNVFAASGQTVFGETDTLMNQQYESIQYTSVSLTTWIGT